MLSIAELPKYEAYKESGIEWLGVIPSEWEVKPGMLAFSESKKDNKGMKESTVLSLSYGRIVVKPEEKLVGLVPESFETYQLVDPGDIIIRCTDLQNDQTSLRTGLAKDKGIITSAYLNLKVNNGYDARFMHYYLHALDISKVLYKFGTGLRQNLSYGDFKRLPTFEIPHRVQVNIANFLDKKTTQIDEAIAIKEQQIALLKERKQIIIQKAVTQGIEPNVPMKDSGVDWIGEIPAHWEVVKLKLLANKIVDGAHFTPTYVDKGVPFLRVTDLTKMKSGRINWNEVRYIPEKEHRELIKRAKADKGDVLLSKNGTIGLTAVIDWDIDFSFFVSLCLIKLKPALSPNYFSSFFNSPIVDRQITFGSSRTSVTNLHLEKIKELLIILPPIDEQGNIGDYINDMAREYDPAVDLQQRQIEKLKEYKTTLINSAVTGKIKITPDMVETSS